MSQSLQVPPSPSPSSSKRSRSRDSARSQAASSLDTQHPTPSASAPSLVAAQQGETRSSLQPSPHDPTPYPAFLRQPRADIHQKFVDLEWEQRRRAVLPQLNGNGNANANGNANSDATGDGEQPSQWARCAGDDVKDRNRYQNVDPYLNNRVRLKVPDGLNDYINASPIVLKLTRSGKVLRYIATQGPKYDTYSHFWRMLWHETTSPAVVVMLTQTHEAAREKCFPYYPESLDAPILRVNPQDEYEDGFIHELKLARLEDHEDARAQVRELDMTTEDGSETKKVWHLLFAGWPDFLVPEGSNREALLRLIHMSREKNADNATNPRIVHCSAGVGRSGTFIALDWLLQELDEGALDDLHDKEDPVLDVVNQLRQQRMMMVQSEPQLAFIYDVMRDCWRHRWVTRHPDEAERLGVTRNMEEKVEGPRLKRQKSGPGEREQHPPSDEDERTQLEAELFDSEMDFDKGKT